MTYHQIVPNVRAPPSRTATGTDRYAFNATLVRAKIRRESLVLHKKSSSAPKEDESIEDE
jgi:hypothetical protein